MFFIVYGSCTLRESKSFQAYGGEKVRLTILDCFAEEAFIQVKPIEKYQKNLTLDFTEPTFLVVLTQENWILYKKYLFQYMGLKKEVMVLMNYFQESYKRKKAWRLDA